MTATPPTLTSSLSAGAGVKTYASSDVAVCTINSSTGEVAFVGAGTCSITVSVAQTSDYNLATSAAVSFTLNRATQNVSWSPTTAVLITQSPLTPSASASSSGDGAISYAVASQGATSCSVNSSTGVLTYSAAGSCEVRATAAQTARYSQATTDVTFVVTLAAPAFTLSSGSESKAQNTAITGYTISSTGGAIASYSISPSAPTGTSFNTSTGLLSGTPSTVQSATVYTITATNATSSAAQTFTLTVTVTAPAFTLSSSSESKAQNTAISGYTISSTGGAIASYSISPSAPTGTSFNTLTGLLSGTPTSVQSATTYTITATNATSSASRTFALTVTAPASCADGGVCALGNTGPGGGTVFYVRANGGTFTSTGSDCGSTCKYLEAAPTGWSVGITLQSGEIAGSATIDPRLKWCNNNSTLRNATTKTAIGDGRSNTTNGLTCTAGAIFHVELYANNGKTDWHLASRDELNQMCKWVRGQAQGADTTACNNTGSMNSGIGASGFSDGTYLSSSELSSSNVWNYLFRDGSQAQYAKNWQDYVRPIRAFG